MSADTIVPEPMNPQALNRYAYVLGNPLKYVDPSGHAQISPDDGGCASCGEPQPAPKPEPKQDVSPCATFMSGLTCVIVFVLAPVANSASNASGHVQIGPGPGGTIAVSAKGSDDEEKGGGSGSATPPGGGGGDSKAVKKTVSETLKKLTARVKWRAGVQDKVLEKAPENDLGEKICMGCGKKLTRENLNVDHYKSVAWRRANRQYPTREDWIDDYNNIDELRPLCNTCNQSHRFENTPTERLPFFKEPGA